MCFKLKFYAPDATNLTKPSPAPLAKAAKPLQSSSSHAPVKTKAAPTGNHHQNKENSLTAASSLHKVSSAPLSKPNGMVVGASTATALSSALELMTSGLHAKQQQQHIGTPTLAPKKLTGSSYAVSSTTTTTSSNNNSNIVKKTFAKMTAFAFKQTNKQQQQQQVVAVDKQLIKSKLLNARNNSSKPLVVAPKEDHEHHANKAWVIF